MDDLVFKGEFGHLKITSGIQITGKVLGTGSDATVLEVDWNGTLCAAKELHEILLRDQSPGGAEHFIANFMKECRTWSTLRHPQIIQILGVYFRKGSRVPMLILEKMDTSLRHHLDNHIKEDFVLPDKVYIFRQVAQALSYLHSRCPPLVHHDLSTNNILLNEVSMQAKVTDFGMTRSMDLSKMTRKSSVKGTQAFMAPEALTEPPKYDNKLDVFSYGNVIIHTVTHEWPHPGQPTVPGPTTLIAVSEIERRVRYLCLFTPEENKLFRAIVCSCLENQWERRPTSLELVTQMRTIEKSHPRVHADITMSAKTSLSLESGKQYHSAQKQKSILAMTRSFDYNEDRPHKQHHQRPISMVTSLPSINDQSVRERKFLEEISQQCEDIKRLQLERGQHIKEIERLRKDLDLQKQEIEQLREHLSAEQAEYDTSSTQYLQVPQFAEKSSRKWRNVKCQKIIKCGYGGRSVATKKRFIAVGVSGAVEIYSKGGNQRLFNIGKGSLGSNLCGITFYDRENILVSDTDNSSLKMLSTQGLQVESVFQGNSSFKPYGITVGPDGLVYVCDVGSHCVCVFDVKGTFYHSFGSHGSDDNCFNSPRSLCFGCDHEHSLYITDAENCRICVYHKDGKFVRKFATAYKPDCIASTVCGHLVVSSYMSDKIVIYTTGGDLVQVVGSRGSKSGQFQGPYGVAVDGNGSIYIADLVNSRIQIF